MQAAEFPYVTTVEVAFRDIDAFGHVNNAVFFSYMEYARVKFAIQLFSGTELATESLLDIPLILVEATCSYRSPALLSEKLVLGVGLSRFGNTSFDLVYRLEGEDGRLVAIGKTIQVMYNYATGSAFPIPQSIRDRVHTFQKGWQPPPVDR
ncbi:MAG: acyl-CoA thioesterase [Candidatus Promineifilaceae bacterium]|jgi:acyl-CoA thioester hydrolase